MTDDPHGPLYSLVCTDTNPYGTWQTEFLEHTWLRSGTPGELIRLVAADAGEELPTHHHARVVRTESGNTHPLMTGEYAGMNRLRSIDYWLETERPVGTVLILDCDFVFRSPVTGRAEPGRPIAQEWWGFGVGDHWADAAEVISPGTVEGGIQHVTWPLLMHSSDLRRIIRRWIEVTARLRELSDMWESDMVALVLTLAEFGLTCETETLGAWMDWPEDFVEGAPIIHYCQPVKDTAGDTLWYKQDYEPWDAIDVDPSAAAFDYTRDLLQMLQRFVTIKRAATGSR